MFKKLSYIFLSTFFSPLFCFLDAARSWQFTFQDPATPIMCGIINFHNHIMFFLTFIIFFVSWLLFRCLFLFEIEKNSKIEKWSHSTHLEIFWTLVPAIILIFIAIPSFGLLFSMDEVTNCGITLKVVANQWFWSYEFSDYATSLENQSLIFDSYMLSEDLLIAGNLRLLEVDNRVVLPTKIHIKILVTSSDVLHSWCVPSFGIKIDACPGRLNQTSFFIQREGVFFGQCSEICGINHGFMPIVIESVCLENYIFWITKKLDEILL